MKMIKKCLLTVWCSAQQWGHVCQRWEWPRNIGRSLGRLCAPAIIGCSGWDGGGGGDDGDGNGGGGDGCCVDGCGGDGDVVVVKITRAASQGHSSGSAGRPPTILVWNRFAFVPHSEKKRGSMFSIYTTFLHSRLGIFISLPHSSKQYFWLQFSLWLSPF